MNINIKKIWREYATALIFLIISLIGFYFSGLSYKSVLSELVERVGRNLFLVISLIIPLMAGMGINFAIVIGAMAGQIAIIITLILNVGGIGGVLMSMLIALPMGIVLGIAIGGLFNKTKGREMIAGLIVGYFAAGVYQLICISIPVKNNAIGLEGGMGIKSSIDLKSIQYALDRFLFDFKILGIRIPLFTILILVILCYSISYIKNTKLGQNFRAVGQNMAAAESVGIDVNSVRIKAVIFSTVLAAWGQIISLQNLGTMSTFGSHEQVSLYSAAALLVGGASMKRVGVKNAVLGTILFYVLFIVAPKAGNNIFGSPQIGEFFRVFAAYGIIALSLVLNNKKNNN